MTHVTCLRVGHSYRDRISALLKRRCTVCGEVELPGGYQEPGDCQVKCADCSTWLSCAAAGCGKKTPMPALTKEALESFDVVTEQPKAGDHVHDCTCFYCIGLRPGRGEIVTTAGPGASRALKTIAEMTEAGAFGPKPKPKLATDPKPKPKLATDPKPKPKLATDPKPKLATDPKARKAAPMDRGLLRYFPKALAYVAEVSRIGNEQHNPGQPMHWAKEKSTDHGDCIVRHQCEAGTFDADKVRHSGKVAWRALAQLEIELEEGDKA
jgi:hypothetical protein